MSLLTANKLFATHYMGVDISYECLDSCNYRIYHTTYYDCTGSAVPNRPNGAPIPGPPPTSPGNFQIDWIESSPNCGQPLALQADWTVDSTFGGSGYIDVTPVCPTITTGCTVANGWDVRGVVGVRYVRDYSFCSVTCDNITVQWRGFARNNALNGITNPGGQGIFVNNLVIDFLNAPCNSSPIFDEPPIPYLCEGQSFTFNQGVTDPDGDSLRFYLGECFDNNNDPVTWNIGGGFGFATPLGSGWTVTVDSLTGDVTMTPTPNGPPVVTVMCIYVEEYDKQTGVLIGQTVRDMQITVIPCNNTNAFPVIDSVTNLSPGNIQTGDFDLTICACELVCWDLPAIDPDSNQNHILFWSQNLDGAYLTSPFNPSLTTDTLNFATGDSLLGRFCWIPQEVGFFTTTFTIRDDGCPILGQNQYTAKIRVVTCSLDPVATTRRTNCYEVQFSGQPCGGGVDDVQYVWSGDGGLTGDSSTILWDFGGPGTYAYTLTVIDSSGQTATVTDSIKLFNAATSNAGADRSLCSYEVESLGTPALPGYTYNWSSPQGVGWNGPSNPSGAEPEVVYVNTSQNPVTIPYYLVATDPIGCESLDTVNVTYEPSIANDFFITSSVCVDEPTIIQYSAPLIPGATYTWDYAGAVGTLNGPGPHSIVWSTPGQKEVKLVVNADGCDSDTGRFVVTVFEKPSSDFNLAPQTCQNSNLAITYAGAADPNNATFTWDFGGGNAVQTMGGYNVSWTTPGVKTIRLTVEENGCISDETVKTIVVTPTPSSSFFMQDSVCLGDIAQATYVGSNSAAASFDWEFNGATLVSGSGIGPYQFTWATPGTKDVCLTVRDQGCVSARICRQVYVSPSPNINIDPVQNQCFKGNSFSFSATGDPADNYFWDFGAGAFPQTSIDQLPPSVTYSTPGFKTVRLVTSVNGCGGDTSTYTFEVVDEPSADFQADKTQACSNDRLNFTYLGTPSGPTQTFNWDFGPGAIPATSSIPSPQNVSYTSGGQKTVELTVSYKGCTVTTTQVIQVNEAPFVDAGTNQEYCEGDGGVRLNGTVVGGSQPYFYNWTCSAGVGCGIDSVNSPTPFVNPQVTNPTEEVVYYFEVTDAFGCVSGVDSVVVTVKAKPKLDAGMDASICPPKAPGYELQGTLRADNNAPLPITYEWFPATGLDNPTSLNPTARPDTTTIYTLTGTSTNGCTSTATTVDPRSSMTLTILAAPTAEAGLDTGICVGGDIRLNGFATGAGPNYTYTWTPALPGTIDDPSSPSPLVSPNATTTFTLVVSSEGCSAADSVTITVDTKPTVSAGNDRDLCKFQTLGLDGKANGDPNATLYNYSWTPGLGLSDSTIAEPTAKPDVTTTYTVIARTDAGCESEPATITLNVLPTPEVDLLQEDTIICAGQPLNLVAVHSYAGMSEVTEYNWTPQEILNPFLGDSITTAFPTQTGYIEVTASSLGGKCSTTDRFLVEVTPAISVAIEADTNRICEGEAIELRAIGGLGSSSYQWIPSVGLSSDLVQNPLASPGITTNYQVVLTEGACKDTADYLVDVTPTPKASYFVDLDQGCGELTVSFNNNTPDAEAYIWDFGDGSDLSNEPDPVHTYANPGNYKVKLTTVGGNLCETSAENITIVVSPLPTADFTSVPMVNTDLPLPEARVVFTDASVDAVGWLWEFGDGGVSTLQNPEHTYTQEGVYTVKLTITDASGCVSTVTYGVFSVFEPSLNIPNVFTPNGDGSNDIFQVTYTGTEQITIMVMDRWGRRLFETTNSGDAWDGRYNGNDVPEGTYYYAVQVGEKLNRGNLTLLR
ncbi:MAG: PKD domain-containing protein [Bacteroidia bacterium]|nr:PKD domain-containing protein [Bacteroidia bacterium]